MEHRIFTSLSIILPAIFSLPSMAARNLYVPIAPSTSNWTAPSMMVN